MGPAKIYGYCDPDGIRGNHPIMQYQSFEPGIEVNGQTVYSIVDGFQVFRRLASRVMEAEGLGQVREDGDLRIDLDAWYSQDAWLRAFAKIAEKVGTNTLLAIGRRIPENAKFPDEVVDLPSAIAAIDVAYHLNHRKQGEIMFDPSTGAKLDGIGSYGCEIVGPRELIAVCKNPYPCDFDRGILLAMARRFEPLARVEHDERRPCRKQGADDCTYSISW